MSNYYNHKDKVPPGVARGNYPAMNIYFLIHWRSPGYPGVLSEND
jgi:hypothetical protein